MDDVVDLDEVLAAARLDVGRAELVWLESVEVAFVDVGARLAVDEPLGHCPGDTRRVGDPDRLGHPEPRDIGVTRP